MKAGRQRELIPPAECPCDIVKAAGRWRDALKTGTGARIAAAELNLVYLVDESRKNVLGRKKEATRGVGK